MRSSRTDRIRATGPAITLAGAALLLLGGCGWHAGVHHGGSAHHGWAWHHDHHDHHHAHHHHHHHHGHHHGGRHRR